jgi:hypothetical protein
MRNTPEIPSLTNNDLDLVRGGCGGGGDGCCHRRRCCGGGGGGGDNVSVTVAQGTAAQQLIQTA